jgi:hypothetical protein
MVLFIYVKKKGFLKFLFLLFAPKSPKGDLLNINMFFKPPLGGRGQIETY